MKRVMGTSPKELDETTTSEANATLDQLNQFLGTDELQDGVNECTEGISTCQTTDCSEKSVNDGRENGDNEMYSEIPEPNNIPITNNTTPASTAEAEVDDEDTQASQTADGSAASVNTFRTFIWLLAGIVVRLAITSRFNTYIQTLMYPFIAIEISIYGTQYALGIDVTGGNMLKSGLWISLLHLAGIERNLIESYGLIMGYVYSTLDDFAVYLFAFVLTHVIL